MTGRFLNSLYFWCWILKLLSVGSGWKQYWYVVKFCFLVEGSGYLKPDTTSLVVNRQMLNHFSGYTAGSGIQTDIWLPSKKYKLSEDQLYILLLKNYQWETKPSFNIIGNFAHKREKEYHNENWTRTASVRPEEGKIKLKVFGWEHILIFEWADASFQRNDWWVRKNLGDKVVWSWSKWLITRAVLILIHLYIFYLWFFIFSMLDFCQSCLHTDSPLYFWYSIFDFSNSICLIFPRAVLILIHLSVFDDDDNGCNVLYLNLCLYLYLIPRAVLTLFHLYVFWRWQCIDCNVILKPTWMVERIW